MILSKRPRRHRGAYDVLGEYNKHNIWESLSNTDELSSIFAP